MTTPSPRPIGYAMLWSSGPNKPVHSREFFWADAMSYSDIEKSMFEKYGHKGQPPMEMRNGQWLQVVPLYDRSGKKGKR